MHLRCEVCGGPENWCLDVSGDVWVRCMDEQCSSLLQTSLFPEEPIWEEGVASASEGDDSDALPESDPSEILAAIRAVDPSF